MARSVEWVAMLSSSAEVSRETRAVQVLDAPHACMHATAHAQSPPVPSVRKKRRPLPGLPILLGCFIHSGFGIRHRSLFAERSPSGPGTSVLSTDKLKEKSSCCYRALLKQAQCLVTAEDSREIPCLHPATARARRKRTERLLQSSDENEQRRNRPLANRLIEPCDLTRVQSPKHVREEQSDPADDQHGRNAGWRRIVVVVGILSETSQSQ